MCPARDRHWLVRCGQDGVTVKMMVVKLGTTRDGPLLSSHCQWVAGFNPSAAGLQSLVHRAGGGIDAHRNSPGTGEEELLPESCWGRGFS